MAPRRRNDRRRNLTKRGRVWQYERVIHGKCIKKSLRTSSLEEAIARRDALERQILARPYPFEPAPAFAAASREALADMDALRDAEAETAYAFSTARDRRQALKEDGPILPYLGHVRLDSIDVLVLRRWHDAQVIGCRRSLKTGDNYLDAIEQVFRFARRRGYIDARYRPVAELREQIRGERRTKSSRAAVDRRRRFARDGVLTPDEVGRLTAAARAEGTEPLVIFLLAVECGLRRGEIFGLRWGDVAFGENEDDPTRAIEVRHTRPRGEADEAPKSGRVRRPHISRRLRHALRELQRARWEPGPDARVIRRTYYDFEKPILRRVLKRAGLPRRTLQNLRATCSSLLKQWGVAPAYVQAALGHESEGVAQKHYDALDFRLYRPPETLRPNETPMDLFARLCEEDSRRESPQSPLTSEKGAHATATYVVSPAGFEPASPA